MPEFRVLLLECFLLYSVILFQNSSATSILLCGRNEEFSDCVNRCDRCVDRENCVQILSCEPGCQCLQGYFRNSQGRCVPEYFCDNKKCGINEEYQNCGTACPDTCDNMGKPRPCPKICVAGCFCKRGFVRNRAGFCIRPQQCQPPQQGMCRDDEVYLECGSSCPPTCENYGKPIICTAQCVSGCFCRNGLVRNKYGRCIIPERCGRQTCNYDEEFQTCGSSCPDTCSNYGKPRYCTLECVQGCFCKRGLVRAKNFRCIKPERCKKRFCNFDEVYKRCGSACPRTCDSTRKPQPHSCQVVCVNGCFCRDGTIRNLDTMKCVRPQDCDPMRGK